MPKKPTGREPMQGREPRFGIRAVFTKSPAKKASGKKTPATTLAKKEKEARQLELTSAIMKSLQAYSNSTSDWLTPYQQNEKVNQLVKYWKMELVSHHPDFTGDEEDLIDMEIPDLDDLLEKNQ